MFLTMLKVIHDFCWEGIKNTKKLHCIIWGTVYENIAIFWGLLN